MECPYCSTVNMADEHRCQRCGRRLDPNGSPYLRQPYRRAATAPALQPDLQEKPEVNAADLEQPAKRSAPVQRSLFQSRVVSFESYAPEAVEPRVRTRTVSKPRHKAPIPGQESFEFESYETVITQPAPPPQTAEPVIACDARVATPVHRCMATALDFSIVIIAAGLFFSIFYLAGGTLILNVRTIPFCAGIAAVLYLMYELLFCMAESDTPGMLWTRLKLVDFDGGRPNRDQRVMRLASFSLSVLSAGLGVLWALVDEESLTWHDHISQSFPTPF